MSDLDSKQFYRQLKLAMQRDQFRLRRRFQKLRRVQSEPARAKERDRLQAALRESIDLRQARQDRLPQPELDPELPIFEKADEIKAALLEHQVVVVSGETGSGKSTQLPLLALQAGFGAGGFIGHTQPRRIAARGVAARVAKHLNCNVGDEVGFKIRFTDKSSDRTFVKLMTDGILLAETAGDRFLDAYEMIIVDEAHERSLNIDFLLGYLKRLLNKREQLRLVITSATIDTARFAEHFKRESERDVPVIHVSGRNYPVDIQYRPAEVDEFGETVDVSTADSVTNAVLELAAQDRGDILVFLPTEHDIRITAKKLRAKHFPGDGQTKTEILPLYARLSNEQQNAIFEPGKRRRVVLATNVAESSVTVPRIRYVVDSGTARISRYAPRSKVQRLPIEAISQASADQRAGRCGRIGPGVCVRLYSEEDYESRPRYTTPEIRRTNLASVILQTKALRLGEVEEFPFMDPPRPELIRDGYRTLEEIGAVDQARQLTSLGRQLSKLPADPRIGRMLFAGSEYNCLAEVLIIASALEIQDPRLRPAERQQAADQLHARFNHEDSDFLAWLNLWDFFHELRNKLSRSRFRKACQENFLSYNQFQQWSDIHRQLREMAKSAGLSETKRKDDYGAIHKSLLTGLLSGIAMLSDKYEYTGAGGTKFHLWPGSGLFRKKPKWIVAAEIVETNKRYGRTLARIDPEWIEPLAEHLVKRSYSDPHWSKRSDSAMVYEKVSLFGLPVVARRRVRLASIDPVQARQLFIRHGLVEGQMRRPPEFLLHNQRLQEEAEERAAKTRRRDWVVEEATLESFYEQRLPDEAVDAKQLHRLLKSDNRLADRLELTLEDLLGDEQTATADNGYPSQVQVGELQLPVHYRFAPGEPDDGATLEVPVEAAAQLERHRIGWLVPGLIPDRVEAMIRSLPKSIRRSLIPAPDTAAKVAKRLEAGQGSFEEAVAKELSQIAQEPIRPNQFDDDKIPPPLKPNFRLVDEAGETIIQSRSLDEVVRHSQRQTGDGDVAVSDTTWQQDGLTDWTWDELPEQITVKRGDAQVPLFPTILDQGDAVGLRLYDHRQRARLETKRGLDRLVLLAHRKLVKSQVNWLPELNRLALLAAPLFGQPDNLKRRLAELLVRVATDDAEPLPKTRTEYEHWQARAPQRIAAATQDVAGWLPSFLETYHEVRLAREQTTTCPPHAKEDIDFQLSQLFVDDFLRVTPWEWLKHFPRYLQGILVRLESLASGNLARDQQHTNELIELWNQWGEIASRFDERGEFDPQLERVRWLIEEYRVSLFAQKLGTCEKVSPKRIEKELAQVPR